MTTVWKANMLTAEKKEPISWQINDDSLKKKKLVIAWKNLLTAWKSHADSLKKKIWKQPKKHTDSLKSLFSKRVLWEWEMQSWARVPEKLLRLASVRIFKTASRLASLRRFSGKYFAHSWFCVIVHRVRILRCFGASEGGGASLCVCPSNLVWICGGRERP